MSTDQYFVYVIQLNEDVKNRDKWLKRNPNQTRPECYYVGSSSHTPECRFQQHRTTSGEPFLCKCHKRRGRAVNPFQIGKWPEAMKLTPEKYSHLNSDFLSEDQAREIEKNVAQSLMGQGYGIWTDKCNQRPD